MKRMKSTLALLIALVMVMAIFLPACGKKEPSTGTEQTSDGTNAGEPKEKKEIEISIAMWDFQEFGNDDIGKKISDDLKIKITTQPLSWDNDLEQVKLFGASGSLPDVIATYTVDSDSTRFYSWLDQGLTRTIPEELVNKYPSVKNVFDNDPVVNAIKQLRGEYTYIPRPGSLKNYYVASQQVVYYRKDWMQNVGIEKEPENMDEFYDMVKAFTNNDPDQNGKADTYGLTSARFNTAFFGIWGIDTAAWIKEDDKFIPAYLSKQNIEPLKYFRKLYEEKIYDPEFAQNGWKQAVQKFTTNTFGTLARNGDLHWLNKTIIGNWAVANPEVSEPLSVVGVLGPMKKDASATTTGWPLFLDPCGSEISANVDDEKLDRILELFEYMMQPETKKMISYGFEGVDYTVNGDEMELAIDPATNEAVNINAKYPSAMISSLADWNWDNDIEDPYVSIAPEVKELGKTVRDQFNPIAIKDDYIAVRYISTPARDTTSVEWTDAFTQIVMGKEDVEAMFNKFVQEAMDIGMAKVIEEVNAKTTELGIN